MLRPGLTNKGETLMPDANMREAIAFQGVVNEIKVRQRSMDSRDEADARLTELMMTCEDFELPQYFVNELWEIQRIIRWNWRFGA
jgi:hypothetical protein